MGLLLQIGRIFLGITNFVFVLIGLTLFLFGILAKYGDSFGSYYETIISRLETSLSGAGFPNSNLDFDIGELAGSLSTSLILSGTILLIIAVVAIIAIVSKKRCLLLLYSVVLIVFITSQLITLCIFYGKPALITDPVKDGLKSSIQSEYQGFNGTNFESIAWNFINQKFSCCGVESYQDFTSATDWLYNYTGTGIILVTPLSCCQSLPTSDNFTCAESLSSTVNNYNTGCFNKLWDIVIGNPAITAPVISLCLLMQILFLATTIVLFKNKSHKKRKIRPGSSDIAWAS